MATAGDMTCAEIRRLLAEGVAIADDPSEGPAAAHLAGCPACQQLAADDARLARLMLDDAGDATFDFDALERSLAAESRSPLGWLRERPTWARMLIAPAVVGLVALVALLSPRADLPLYPKLRFAIELALLGVVSLAAIWAWLRPLHLPSRPGLVVATSASALLLPTVLALMPAAHAPHSAAELTRSPLPCLIFGAALAVPVVLVVLGLGRRLGTARRGLLAAGAGGGAGVIGLHLHCPSTLNGHLLMGHATVPLLIGLVLAALLATITRRRARSS